METPTSRSTNRGRWTQFAVGAVALVTATTIASAAGAATTPANAPIGATGSVAALSGSTMEVQNPSSGQTTVNWTSTTSFSKSVTEAVNSLTAGTCVTVTGTPSKSSKTTIAARSISVVATSTTGSCTGQFRPGSGTGGANGPRGGGFRFGGRGGRHHGWHTPDLQFGVGPTLPQRRLICHRDRQGDGRQRIDALGLRVRPLARKLRPAHQIHHTEDEEAGHAQDGEPQDHDHRRHHGRCDPECRGDGPGRR